MSDGKNGLCASIQIIIFLVLMYYNNFSFIMYKEFGYVFFLIFFLFFNLRGKVFMGDSGVYLGSFIIINSIFNTYINVSNFKTEQIFILLMIPGIDMFRVFLLRVFKLKNPFVGDSTHFHHLLNKKFKNNFITLLIYLCLVSFSNVASLFFSTHLLIIICVTIFTYLIILYKISYYEI
jgi:UDP-GlcNAc:undecaprenyl-phosphate GlcNAc-1-phosphate transferase